MKRAEQETIENSPVSLWEEDFSAAKRYIEKLRLSGVTDLQAFFASHPEELSECFGEIRVLDVNMATLALTHATHKDQLIGSLPQIIQIEANFGLVGEMVSIAEGQSGYTWESVNYTLDGERLTVSLRWSAEPGFEDTLEKVLVSVLDITDASAPKPP